MWQIFIVYPEILTLSLYNTENLYCAIVSVYSVQHAPIVISQGELNKCIIFMVTFFSREIDKTRNKILNIHRTRMNKHELYYNLNAHKYTVSNRQIEQTKTIRNARRNEI